MALPGSSDSDLAISSEKLLDEIQRTQDKTHLRARRLIMLTNDLFSFSVEEEKREVLGPNLTNMLDSSVELLRGVYRKHLVPSLMRLAPLNELDIGENSPESMLAKISAAIVQIKAAGGSELVAMAPNAQAVLLDMQQELQNLSTAIALAKTPEHREGLRKRFARSFGALSATVGRYVEKSAPHADKPGKWADLAIKNYKRWQSLADILDWFTKLFGSGPPTP